MRTARWTWELRAWRTIGAAAVLGLLVGLAERGQPAPAKPLVPASGLAWVPDALQEAPGMGRLMAVTADGKLIQTIRQSTTYPNGWTAWAAAPQDK